MDVDLRAAPILVGGEIVGSYAIYHDLSDVHRQKQYFESLLEISPTAIVTVGLDDKVTSWNPAARSCSATRVTRRWGGTSMISSPPPRISAPRRARSTGKAHSRSTS